MMHTVSTQGGVWMKRISIRGITLNILRDIYKRTIEKTHFLNASCSLNQQKNT